MTAPTAIDAERVHALNRLIREKTGRMASGTPSDTSRRKNLWLQLPPAQSRQRTRRTVRHRAARMPTEAGAPAPARRTTRARRPLTLFLGTALLLTTAATAI